MLVELLATLAVILLGSFIYIRLIPKPRPATRSEREYIVDGNPVKFRSLIDVPTVELSVIIPCYNEQFRLPVMLKETHEYLVNRQASDPSFCWEIILVDDGSADLTCKVATDSLIPMKIMRLSKNRGKGGAVTQGMLSASGKRILFVDADGATRFSDVEFLEAKLGNGGCCVGSRAHLVASSVVVKRSAFRNFLMNGFHLLVFILGIREIKDTQCGFKLFSRKAAQQVFPFMHVERWIFDIEVLILCQRSGVPVQEVSVNWHEVDGTKLNVVTDSLEMLVQLLVIRLNYALGLW